MSVMVTTMWWLPLSSAAAANHRASCSLEGRAPTSVTKVTHPIDDVASNQGNVEHFFHLCAGQQLCRGRGRRWYKAVCREREKEVTRRATTALCVEGEREKDAQG